MNKLIKKLINAFLKFLFIFVKSGSQRAAIVSRVSKILFSGHNSLVYDSKFNAYWLKHDNEFLFITTEPYYNFSKNNLYKSIYDIYCKNYEVKTGDVIVDVGAGIGTETLFFREKIGATGKIYSIEASTDSCNKLKAMCDNNGIKNSLNFNIAISDFNGKIWIEETEHFEVNQVNTSQKGIEVNCYTLDQFVNDNHITKIDLLKVNIEGAEGDMIDGMKKSIAIIENVAVSCHDFLFEGGRGIKKKFSDFLQENNFEVLYNSTGNQVTDSWIYGRRKK